MHSIDKSNTTSVGKTGELTHSWLERSTPKGSRKTWSLPYVHDTEPERLFAEGVCGTKEVTWFERGLIYEFSLYAGKEHRRRLATTRVVWGKKLYDSAAKDLDLQSGKAFLTVQSSPVGSRDHFAKGVISWNTGDGSVGQVFVKKSRRPLAAIFSRTKTLMTRNPDRFLKKVSGVVHVGANTGQERDDYRKFGLRVIWIEPSPDVFQRLKANLTGYPEQLAFQYLITDQNDSEYLFHVANNAGQSSSILDFAMHKDIWPHVRYESALRLRSIKLSSFFEKERINATDYQALVMDTQGTELLVLKGADSILDRFRFIKTEVADFECYKNCCQLHDIEEYLKQRGFREFVRTKFAKHPRGGRCYNVVYRRTA
jgi:FkbM family methyltransferase